MPAQQAQGSESQNSQVKWAPWSPPACLCWEGHCCGQYAWGSACSCTSGLRHASLEALGEHGGDQGSAIPACYQPSLPPQPSSWGSRLRLRSPWPSASSLAWFVTSVPVCPCLCCGAALAAPSEPWLPVCLHCWQQTQCHPSSARSQLITEQLRACEAAWQQQNLTGAPRGLLLALGWQKGACLCWDAR